MRLTRGEFLQQMALVGASGPFMPAVFQRLLPLASAEGISAQQAANDRVLVIVQMAGGNDGLNTVVPYGDGKYYDLRKNTGIQPAQVIPLNNEIGLHSSLTSFKQMWVNGTLAIVEGVGYPNPSFSHFEAMRIWQSADPALKIQDGWLGRYMGGIRNDPQAMSALSVGKSVAQSMYNVKVSVPSVEDIQSYALQGDLWAPLVTASRLEALNNLYSAMPPTLTAGALLKGTYESALSTSRKLQDADKAYTTTVVYPQNELGRGLKLIAEAICGDLGLQICHVSIGGWDTHASQNITHSRLLAYLADGIRMFHEDLKAHGKDKNVLIMTWSEFGRRAQENGSAGTDHGTAGPLFLAGTPVKGGLYGQRPDLTKLDNGNLSFTVDFRSVYSTILEKWLNAPAAVILGGSFEALPFLA
ncbi:MAG: DUF1501 domain-containing protein [Dehalococcoidia bacterium]|nr:DUF1501 domain-containing protein [Dehalococcoidia bacterium]